MVKKDQSIPAAVFKDVIRKPAIACGVNGTLGKIKGKNKWCIVTEAEEVSAMRYADYITTGEAAFGETTFRARPLGRQRIRGFHILESELDVGDSEQSSTRSEDAKDLEGKVDLRTPLTGLTGQALSKHTESDAGSASAPGNVRASKGEETGYVNMPTGGITTRNRPRSSSTWKSSFRREKKKRMARPRVKRSTPKKSADGWISCAPQTSTATSGNASGSPAPKPSRPERISDGFR